jgi:hypothetical protein
VLEVQLVRRGPAGLRIPVGTVADKDIVESVVKSLRVKYTRDYKDKVLNTIAKQCLELLEQVLSEEERQCAEQ